MNAEILFLLNKILAMISQNKTNLDYANTLAECKARGILDTSDIMLLFNNSERTIERWRKKNIIKFKKIKGRYYYKWTDIYTLLDGGYQLHYTCMGS